MKNVKCISALVELGVLMIFSTMFVLSFWWYSSDARNAKRVSDLKNIEKAISMKMVNGSTIYLPY